jgi:hypothetical protein
MPVHHLHTLGTKGHKLRDHPIELLCISCKKPARIARSDKHIVLKQLKNGAYMIKSDKFSCDTCKVDRKLSKIISKAAGEALIASGVKLIK